MGRKQVEIDDKTVVLDILDTAGQDEFASMQDHWIQEGKGFLLVFAIDERKTFEEVSKRWEQIKRTWGVENIPIVLAGNKVDLRDPDNPNQVTYAEAAALAKK